MSGGKKKGAVSAMDKWEEPRHTRYMDSWSKAGRPIMGLDRADDHFLDKQGWSTATQGLHTQVELAEDYNGSASFPHQATFYRPVASTQAAYANYVDWDTPEESRDRIKDGHFVEGLPKQGKQKKGSKPKR